MIFLHAVRSFLARRGVHIERLSTHRGLSLDFDLTRLLGPAAGMILVDVGANIGDFTMRLARLFPQALVIAFEPVPSTFETLISRQRGHASIRCVEVALGDRIGTAKMEIAGQSVWNRLAPKTIVGDQRCIEVTITTLDDFFGAEGTHPSIGLLKTDCEGHDAEVIMGAAGLFSAGRVAAVYCEVNFRRDRQHGDFFEIHDFLTRHSFEFYSLYEHSGVEQTAADRCRSFTNALWIRRN